MANPRSIVGIINEISPSVKHLANIVESGRYEEISFQDGNISLLDKTDPKYNVWSSILQSTYESKTPIYVEVDPDTQIMTEFLIPLKVKVGEISNINNNVEVELIVSHGRHYLDRTSPNFQTLLEILETAKEKNLDVLVTEKLDTHEIIDVKSVPNSNPTTTTMMESQPTPTLTFAPSVVTSQKANELFNLVNSRICCPASGAAPCIPFLYPDDGCWGRAHEMCRLMIASGVIPEKVWIYGNLRVATQNNPLCEVRWGWHVAPILSVNSGSGSQIQVIDPSLFQSPVPQNTWVNIQGDPSPTVVHRTASVFHRSIGGSVIYDDASYTQTNIVLNTYRNNLKLRSVSSSGPPPYLNCITKPAGVQWLGTIGPGATSRWFTWGWPAAWHILWTIMPITPCPKGPQLSWVTQVERANATQCTYWITVKNLTSDPVRFEGRYDVLQR